jgi:hypothetical protein
VIVWFRSSRTHAQRQRMPPWSLEVSHNEIVLTDTNESHHVVDTPTQSFHHEYDDDCYCYPPDTGRRRHCPKLASRVLTAVAFGNPERIAPTQRSTPFGNALSSRRRCRTFQRRPVTRTATPTGQRSTRPATRRTGPRSFHRCQNTGPVASHGGTGTGCSRHSQLSGWGWNFCHPNVEKNQQHGLYRVLRLASSKSLDPDTGVGPGTHTKV